MRFMVPLLRLCPCGSGHPCRDLSDAYGIFCGFVCDTCEARKRAAFNPRIFDDANPSPTTDHHLNQRHPSNRKGTQAMIRDLHHIPLADQKRSKLNVRRHGPKDIDSLAASIAALGLIHPLLIRRDRSCARSRSCRSPTTVASCGATSSCGRPIDGSNCASAQVWIWAVVCKAGRDRFRRENARGLVSARWQLGTRLAFHDRLIYYLMCAILRMKG